MTIDIKGIHSIIAAMAPDELMARQARSIDPWRQEYLYRIIHGLPPHLVDGVVEIGTFRGLTTLWLAAATDAPMWSIDINRAARDAAVELFAGVGMSKRCGFIHGDSLIVLADTPHLQVANVWLIDGKHQYEYAHYEILHAIKAIGDRPGLIFIDDVNVEGNGVRRAVFELGAAILPATLGHMAVIWLGDWGARTSFIIDGNQVE